MNKPNRPRRQRKGDRLLHSGATREQVACDYAIAPFDRCATEMDMMWGIDRLPELVSPETAQRYGIAMADLNAAIHANDPPSVLACANNCIKGMAVMDAEARAAGHPPATGDFWEYEIEGFKFAIMADDKEWVTAKARRPDLTMFTMREAAHALKAYAAVVPMGEVKKHFPKANVTKITMPPPDYKNGGDDIPF